jgi:hypothetical protein
MAPEPNEQWMLGGAAMNGSKAYRGGKAALARAGGWCFPAIKPSPDDWGKWGHWW